MFISKGFNVTSENILFFNETDISNIENKMEEISPKFCIVDSIQTMYDEQISSTPGSISQVKEVTARLMYQAKRQNITTFAGYPICYATSGSEYPIVVFFPLEQ